MENDLSVIVPMYNEEENVSNTLYKINSVLDSLNVDSEIIVVNDGSTDRTLDILKNESQKYRRLKITSYQKNKGLGYALKTGFGKVAGRNVVVIDSDLSYDAKYVADLYSELVRTNADIVLGSPYMKGGAVLGVPLIRLFISKMSNRFFSYVINANVHTITGMLRGYKKEVLDSLYLESNGPQIMMEILNKAVFLGYKITEIPAVLKSRERGKSKYSGQIKKVFSLYFSLLFAEKPIVFFKMAGNFLLLSGVVYLTYLIRKYITGSIGFSDPVITNPVVVLVILGALTLFFGITLQHLSHLKKDILILQKQNKEIINKLNRQEKPL